ncbi:MAG TPA: ATP-binding cassette domain-containing protein [Mycobacteriales bacterium]|nr:ATP-binding cassette domain-containing protein [Mycobacteriales bacterium]
MPVLEVRDLSIRFGGLQALEGVNIDVNEWEIVGLIGPNGAGKTTAFNCITGFYKPNTGTVRYRGEDVTRMAPHRKAAMGFGRTFQNVGMVKSATALENLKTAQHAKVSYDVASGLAGSSASWREERELEQKADAILDLLDLSSIRNTRVGGLSYGTLKLLELGCALATDPDILLLDEPSSGMGPEESDELGERLLVLRKEFGLTMLLIEHHVPLVLRVCDHVYVLNFGRLLAEGQPSVIQTHPEVVAAYLGGEAPEALAQTTETASDAALDEATAGALDGADSNGSAAPRRRTTTRKAPAKRSEPSSTAPATRSRAKKTAAAPVDATDPDVSEVSAEPDVAPEPETPRAAPVAAKAPTRRARRKAAESTVSPSAAEGESA